MVAFPNCKINLGLNILRKRKDGYHDIETIFYPVKLLDALEVMQSAEQNSSIKFTGTGLTVEGNEEDNLCLKAYELLKKDFSRLPPVQIHLHKLIPMGAGLGGGSGDGAFALKLLNEKFELNLTKPELLHYASMLGSDCPFFIINTPCFATGRGELLEEINIDLSMYTIVLVNPGFHVNTGWAFSQLSGHIKPSDGSKPSDGYSKSLKAIIQQPVETWKTELKNDFEDPVFEKHPEIKKIKEELYDTGALYAAMSGSGSTVFGIFDKVKPVPIFSGTNYFVKVL